MSINKVEEMVESYINGNISSFKKWLRKTKKSNIPIVIELLDNYPKKYLIGTGAETVYRLLIKWNGKYYVYKI